MKKLRRKELLAEYANPEDLTDPGGLLKRLTGALVERMYARGMSERDIQAHLAEIYDTVWPKVFLGALVIEVRDSGRRQK
jgi:hypothetical protein